MIPLPVFWREYTATKQGRILKAVSCENCSTEYVYLMERESSGVGTSFYSLNNEGAESHSQSAAAETLKSVLENDFDPVPCPMCGHYQRFMFPKLLETKRMSELVVKLALILVGAIAGVIALRETIAYFGRPNDYVLSNMVGPVLVLLLVGLISLSLWVINRYKVRHFNPNFGDPQTRIAIGRNRAITRAEFEKIQQKERS
jgi:hypothetical protein